MNELRFSEDEQARIREAFNESLRKLVRAIEDLNKAVGSVYGPAEDLQREADRLPDEDGVRYVVRNEGPNRRERRAMARGKELRELDPERVPSPGRRAFRNRDFY